MARGPDRDHRTAGRVSPPTLLRGCAAAHRSPPSARRQKARARAVPRGATGDRRTSWGRSTLRGSRAALGHCLQRMGNAVVRRAAAEVAGRDSGGLSEPRFGGVLLSGLPGFMREGFLPVGAFYVGLHLGGLGAGVAASAAVSALVYLHERRSGRDGLLVRISLAFVAVQSAVGLITDSSRVYLAQPVVVTAIWGFAFLGSAALHRPLAGVFACAWYPFPQAFRETEEFKRVFGVESIVWGVYLVARSGLRLGVLVYGSLDDFVVLMFMTGIPSTLVLVAWSVHYA